MKTKSSKTRILIISIVALVIVIGAIAAWFISSRGKSSSSPQSVGMSALTWMDSGLYADGAEWQQSRDEAEQKIAESTDMEEIEQILADTVKVAGGNHSFLLTSDEQKEVEADYQAPTVSRTGDILTVSLPGFMGNADYGQEYANVVADALVEKPSCGVIIDLRDNDGGDMGPMLAGVSPLLPEGTANTFVMRSPQSESPVTIVGNGVQGGGTPTSVETEQKIDATPIAILIGENTASSGEQTLLAFAGLDDVKVFGQPSAGYASVNMTYPLQSGSQLVLTTGETRDRTGAMHGDSPIDPDQTVPAGGEEAAAKAWLNEKSCNAG